MEQPNSREKKNLIFDLVLNMPLRVTFGFSTTVTLVFISLKTAPFTSEVIPEISM